MIQSLPLREELELARARHPAGRLVGTPAPAAGYVAEVYLHDHLTAEATFRSELAADKWAAWIAELAGGRYAVRPA